MKKSMILIVYEGENREEKIFENLISIFFSGKNQVLIIKAPAESNIIMLYNKLCVDEDADILELIRESSEKGAEILKNYKRTDFSEIYLFFDFDEHSNNGKGNNLEALSHMLEKFDNETENGKLFISYPMVEALRDSNLHNCFTCSNDCFINRADFGKYKEISSHNNLTANFSNYNFYIWKTLSNFYLNRLCCLLKINRFDFEVHYNIATQINIFENQLKGYVNSDSCFVLSSIPNFLLTYSRKNWDSLIGKKKMPKFDKCKNNKIIS